MMMVCAKKGDAMLRGSSASKILVQDNKIFLGWFNASRINEFFLLTSAYQPLTNPSLF
jgi:hypothetical protein